MEAPQENSLVGCCCSAVRKVQLVCLVILGIIDSSKPEIHNMKVVDNDVLYYLTKFHKFLNSCFVCSKNVK